MLMCRQVNVVDLRTVTFDVPPQEILSKDSVTMSVNGIVYYRIFDPIKSVVNVEDVHAATRLLAQTTLRNVLGTKVRCHTMKRSSRLQRLRLCSAY